MVLSASIKVLCNMPDIAFGLKLLLAISSVLTVYAYYIYNTQVNDTKRRSFLIPYIPKIVYFAKSVFFLIWIAFVHSKSSESYRYFKICFTFSMLFDIFILFTISCDILKVFLSNDKPNDGLKQVKWGFTLLTILCLVSTLYGCIALTSNMQAHNDQNFIMFLQFLVPTILFFYLFAKLCELKRKN